MILRDGELVSLQIIELYFFYSLCLYMRSIICDKDNVISKNTPILSPDKKCAPGKKFEHGSCFTLQDIVALVKAYNKYMKKNGMKKNIELQFHYNDNEKSKYKKYLLRALTKELDTVCSDQMCWLKQKFIKELEPKEKKEIMEFTFRVPGPGSRFEWLNTINIDKVMAQYEHIYPDFKFLITTPIDFDLLGPKYRLSEYNYVEMYNKGIYKLGVIFNLDPHDKDGSHWVALYVDLKIGDINFFDSYGVKPPKEVLHLMNTIADSCKKINVIPKIQWNKTGHQKKNTECGVYSLNFIIKSLTGLDMKEINEVRMSDDDVNKCRFIYFQKV